MKSKLAQAFNECMENLYAASTPKGDFKKMKQEAKVNELGHKIIPFMDFELEEEKFGPIIEAALKKYKIDKYHHHSFKQLIYLGCSPKTKMTLDNNQLT